jgi:hypothetical protein
MPLEGAPAEIQSISRAVDARISTTGVRAEFAYAAHSLHSHRAAEMANV